MWNVSPSHTELEEAYTSHVEAEKQVEREARKAEEEEKRRRRAEEKRKRKATSGGEEEKDSDSDRKKQKKKHKHKKHKKEKKAKKEKKDKKKKRKRRERSSSESDASTDTEGSVKGEEKEEWVEMTKELREQEVQKMKEEEAQMIGPAIPEHLLEKSSANFDGKLDAKDKKNMLRGEAAAMAAYAAQGKRIPRRGEIGLQSEEIAEFEKIGYVMSGTRHKSMEATRLRKENQILTAEEKRLLSGFTHEQRKQKEDTVLSQFRNLIDSKKSKT